MKKILIEYTRKELIEMVMDQEFIRKETEAKNVVAKLSSKGLRIECEVFDK